MSPISIFERIWYKIFYSPIAYIAIALLIITIGMIVANKIFADTETKDKLDKP